METKKINPQTMTRTEYVIKNLVGVNSPFEFKVAEKMARTRISELEKIVKGISSKWIKNKTDRAMIDQTNLEIQRIKESLSPLKEKFGSI